MPMTPLQSASSVWVSHVTFAAQGTKITRTGSCSPGNHQQQHHHRSFPHDSCVYKATNDGLRPGWLVTNAVLVLFCIQGMAALFRLHYSCDSFFWWNEQHFPAMWFAMQPGHLQIETELGDWDYCKSKGKVHPSQNLHMKQVRSHTSASSLIYWVRFVANGFHCMCYIPQIK